MAWMRAWLFLHVCWGLCFSPLAAEEIDLTTVRFERLLNGDHAEHRGGVGMVNDILQDERGFIWIAGEHGVARFDAHEFRFYFPDPKDPGAIASNAVYRIARDRKGELWFATSNGLSRYNPRSDDFTTYRHNPNNPASISSNKVAQVAVRADNTLVIGTDRGLNFFDPQRRHFYDWVHDPKNPQSLTSDDVREVFFDSQGRLWIGYGTTGISLHLGGVNQFRHWRDDGGSTGRLFNQVYSIAEDKAGQLWFGTDGSGLVRLDQDLTRFTTYGTQAAEPYYINSDVVREVATDRNGHLWLALDHGGLGLYDPVTEKFNFLYHDTNDPTSLISNQVRCIFADKNNDLWIGSFPAGINYFDRSKTAFKIWKSHPQGLTHNGVLKIFQDSQGVIWIGTEQGLTAYTPATGAIRRYFHEPNNPYSLRANVVVSINEDLQGNLWFGTWSGGLHRFDRATERFHNYFPDPARPNSLLNQHVWAIALDQQGNVWSGHTEQGGLSRYRPATDDFEIYRHDPMNPDSLAYSFVWTLMVDSANRLWIGTLDGLDWLELPDTQKFHHLRASPNQPHHLNNPNIYSSMEHSNGTLWFGTDGGGLNILDPTTRRFTRLGLEQGLSGLRVASLVEDREGFVWAGTSNGVALIDPETLAIKSFHTSDGLAGNTYNRDSLFVDDRGKIYLGSTEGITIIDKSRLAPSTEPPPVTLTQLRIFNDEVSHKSPESPLQSTVGSTQILELNHRHSMFSLGFAALSYRSAFKNQFHYKLDGFDREWHKAKNSQLATYTNLDPGRYVFRVKAVNSSGLWSAQEAELKIHIRPPVWQTWWAYSLYGLFAVSALFGFMHYKTRRLQREQEKELAHKNKLIQLDRMKDSFLASTSHELRTPLNGIIGMTESLLHGPLSGATTAVKESLYLVIASGQRLASLVDDLLDFSKLSNNELKIQLRPVNISQLLDQTITILRPQLAGKALTINNTASGKNVYALADRARIQQVFLHLIENAIKYTERGFIEIGAATNDTQVTVHIKDSGIGIPETEQKWLFSAFNQLAEANTRTQKGTGIGLAIAGKLVQLHGGTIGVRSQPAKGSTFTITLPACQNLPLTEHLSASCKTTLTSAGGARTILIVDDDPVNRLVLATLLKQENLRLLEAASGAEALQLLGQHSAIDLIILDIMMPHMSGIEVCREIRKKSSPDQLPIIFLTAKREEDAREAALHAGGNAFLTKPVSQADLLPCVVEQLQQD